MKFIAVGTALWLQKLVFGFQANQNYCSRWNMIDEHLLPFTEVIKILNTYTVTLHNLCGTCMAEKHEPSILYVMQSSLYKDINISCWKYPNYKVILELAYPRRTYEQSGWPDSLEWCAQSGSDRELYILSSGSKLTMLCVFFFST